MKKHRIVIAAISLLIAIFLVSPAYAQLGSQSFPKIDSGSRVSSEAELELAETTFSDPGLLPDHPFYFLKQFKEKVQLIVTFDEKEKTKLHLKLAKTRLAEAKVLLGKNKTKEAEESVKDFSMEIEQVSGSNIPGVHNQSQDVLRKSSVVLESILERADEHAKPAIEKALNKSIERSVRLEAEANDSGMEDRELVEESVKKEIERRRELREKGGKGESKRDNEENKSGHSIIREARVLNNSGRGESEDDKESQGKEASDGTESKSGDLEPVKIAEREGKITGILKNEDED